MNQSNRNSTKDIGQDSCADVGILADFVLQGGAESLIDCLCANYPNSTLYTAIYDPETVEHYPAISRIRARGRLRPSLAQCLLRVTRLDRVLSLYHFYWLYFFTSIVQRVDRHDVVIVSCCAQSKLARIPQGTRPVVYFHTPTRWLYPELVTQEDLQAIPAYLRGLFRLINIGLRPLDQFGIQRLKKRDPVWLCNSSYIRDKVRDLYGVDARVVFPPVDTSRFDGIPRQPSDFFLYHGRITFQKRVDVAIKGCLIARKKLAISGQAISSGLQQHLEKIVAEAVDRDPSLDGLITFLGRTSDDMMRQLLSECCAMIFPPREDFGIAPIEAITCGVPVIAFGEGGALDYIKPGVNGLFFSEQTGTSLATVLGSFDCAQFHPDKVSRSLPDLSSARFTKEMKAIVSKTLLRDC